VPPGQVLRGWRNVSQAWECSQEITPLDGKMFDHIDDDGDDDVWIDIPNGQN
jgi:hypothetical protein